jgi:hypothetical protein
VGFDELQRRFEDVLVVAVDDRRRRGAVEEAVRPESLRRGGGVGNGLGQNDDAKGHAGWAS